MADKRTTADEVAAELKDGMTIGIGGWGSRRKPMALVRAILRSDLTDLEIVSYGGPDVGLLIAGGHVRRVVTGFVSLDVLSQAQVEKLTEQLGLLPDPGVLIYVRPATLAARISGFADKETVAQAAQNAARGS